MSTESQNIPQAIVQVAFVVSNLEAASAFYCSELELTEVDSAERLVQGCVKSKVLRSDLIHLELLDSAAIPEAKLGFYPVEVVEASSEDTEKPDAETEPQLEAAPPLRIPKRDIDQKKKEELLKKLRKLGSL